MKRILHLSDPHFGAADEKAAEAFLETAASLTPALTVVSGDLTMRARKPELIAARRFLDRLPHPFLVIPGNHDIPSINQPFDRFFHAFRRYQQWFGPELEPQFHQPDLHVVSVNSSRPFGFYHDWSEGRISSSQLAMIRTSLESAPSTALRVLVLHHPLVELQVKGREVVKPLEPLLQTLEHARIDLVLCGHFHRSIIIPAGLTAQWRTVISQAPTVCSTRLQGEPQGFHDICFHRDCMEITHYSYSQGKFLAGGTFTFSRGPGGWHDAARP